MAVIAESPPWHDVRQRASAYPGYDLYHLHGQHDLTTTLEALLVADLARVLPELQISALFELKPGLLRGTDHLIVAVDQSERHPIAVLASRWCRADAQAFLHVVMQLVAPKFQRTHLTKRMWGLHFAWLRRTGPLPSVIALRTYHPSVFVSMRALTRIPGVVLYPRIDGREQDPEMMELARRICASLNPVHRLDPHTGAVKSAGVPRTFYPRMPQCARVDVARYFASHLDEGDRLLCLLRISNEVALARLLRAFGTRAQGEAR